MRAKLSIAAVLAVAVAAPAAVGGTTSVKPVWLAPVELTPRTDNSIWDQDVALDLNGDALAVWAGRGGVASSFRPAGGAWQAPVQLSACGTSARVAFDASGTATAAWLQCTATGGARVTTAFRRYHTGWSQPVALSTPGREAGYLRLAVAQTGWAVASWGESGGHVWVVQASTRRPTDDNAWAPAVQLSTVGADAYDSSPAIDDAGDAIVGWTRGDPAGAIAWVAFDLSGAAWQPAVNLSLPGSVGTDIRVAIRPGGDAFAVWDENGQGRSAVRRASSGTWSPSAPFPTYSVQDLVVDSLGDVLADWVVGNGITAAEIPAGSDTWQQPFPVSSQQFYPLSYAVRFDADGGLVAVWGTQDDAGNGFVTASRRPAGSTSWQTPVTLPVAGTFNDLYQAGFGVDPVGDVAAVYETPQGASVGAALLDSAAPRVASLSFRQTGRVGQRLPFTASPVDFSVVTLRWAFGDGHAATGTSVTHVYRKTGRFRVTLTATDAAGHSTVVARTSVRISRRRS